MKARLQWWLVLCSIVLTCASTAAEDESETLAAAQETAARGSEGSGLGGVFSSILELFRGWSKDPAPEPEQVPGHEQHPAPGDELQPDDPKRTQERVPAPDRTQPRMPRPAQGRVREGAPAEVTHSHVYQATLDLLAEIDILRDAQGIIDGRPPPSPPQPNQRPIHVFVKSLAVMEKTARLQRRLGMIPVEVEPVQLGNVAPFDVLRSVDAIIEELRRVKRQLVIMDEIDPAPFAGGKTASLVYQRLGYASVLLDALVGRPPTSNELYDYVLLVQDRMEAIGARFGAVLERDHPVIEGERAPVECAQQALRAIYKAVNLQFRLGMDASTVPNLVLEQATANDVFDAANILLAEIVRINVHLNVDAPHAERPQSSKKQWRDVFAQLLLVVANIDRLSRAIDDSS